MLGKKEKRKSPAGQLNHWECMRQRQKTEKKKRIQNQIKASKQQKMALGKEMGLCFSVRESGQSLAQRQVPLRPDQVMNPHDETD